MFDTARRIVPMHPVWTPHVMRETCPNDQIGNIDASCGPDRQDRHLVIDRSVPKKRGRLVASSSSLRWIYNVQRQVYSSKLLCSVRVSGRILNMAFFGASRCPRRS